MPQGRGPSVSTMRSRRRWGVGSRGAPGRGRSSRERPSRRRAPKQRPHHRLAAVQPTTTNDAGLALVEKYVHSPAESVTWRVFLPTKPLAVTTLTRAAPAFRSEKPARDVVSSTAYVVAPRGERAHPPAAVGQRRGARRPDFRDQVATVGDDRGADEVRLDGAGPRGGLGAGSWPDERAARAVAEVEKSRRVPPGLLASSAT